MLTSIWSNLVGTNSEDEFEDNRTGPRTEEERHAASLLSQFPPYGTQASKKVAVTPSPHSIGDHSSTGAVAANVASPTGNSVSSLRSTFSSPDGGIGVIAARSPSPKIKKKDGKIVQSGNNPILQQRRGYKDMDFDEDLNYDEYIGFMKKEEDGNDEIEKKIIQPVLAVNPTKNETWKEDEEKLWTLDNHRSSTTHNKGKSKEHKAKRRSKRHLKACGEYSSSRLGSDMNKMIPKLSDDLDELNLEELRRQWVNGASTPNTTRSKKTASGPHTSHSSNPKSPGTPNIKHGITKHFTFSFDGDDDTCEESYSSSEDESPYKDNNKYQRDIITQSNKDVSIQNHFDERQHWMPDRLCKQCYACDAQFTVFRRRHHCRLCGQVFCSSCSYFFIQIIGDRIVSNKYVKRDHNDSMLLMEDGDEKVEDALIQEGSPTTESGDNDGAITSTVITANDGRAMRVCKLCFDQVSASGVNGVYFGNMTDSDIDQGMIGNGQAIFTGVDKLDPLHDSLAPEYGAYPSFLLRRALQEKSAKTNANPSTVIEDDDPCIGENKNFNEKDSPTDNTDASKSNKSTEYKKSKNENTETAVGDSKQEGEQDSVLKKVKSPVTKRRFGRLAESAAREAQIGNAGFNDDEAKLIGTGVKDSNDNDEKTEQSANNQKSNKKNLKSPVISDKEGEGLPNNTLEETMTKEDRKIGLLAADHLQRMGRELLHSDAPLLISELEDEKGLEKWVDTVMMLATRCCATVKPNLKAGDIMSIRPYCKIKVIPGGSLGDSAFISGIMFHKNVCNKKMAKEISNPKIMLLSGGIEYTRTENGFSSLDTLFDQEDKYMEILVTKITQLKPDILIVGRTVSRKAQELLLKAQIILIQQVKQTLIDRIARQTGATVLSSTDHVMHQFGTAILGRCRRFRLVSFRNNDIWMNEQKNASRHENITVVESSHRLDPSKLLLDSSMSNHRRQAVLAACVLGERVHNGTEAVRSGIAKRGVAVTYVMIEGCPSNLGCTVVLRGATKPALKQVKRVLQLLIGTAYNLKLETSYFQSRRAKLPSEYILSPEPIVSSSLCIDYGSPPQGRKIRPWNGGQGNPYILQHSNHSSAITAFDHQSILISSLWMAGKTQCCPAEVKGICYYSQQDVSLEQFLSDSCFNISMKCQNPNCRKSLIDHTLSFFHNDGMINITVELMKDSLPGPPGDPTLHNKNEVARKDAIAMWTYCKESGKVVTPLTYLNEEVKGYSFGKFLEVFFYNRTMLLNSPDHNIASPMQTSSIIYFGCGDLAARFTYAPIKPYGVYLRRSLPFDEANHRDYTLLDLEQITTASSDLFVTFHKHIDRISNETRQLFGSAANKPEHLQTVLSELNSIDSEVSKATQILNDKIGAVTMRYQFASKVSKNDDWTASKDAFMYFPWHSRRYLFMLSSAWNERLSAIGQALSAMKKLASTNHYTASSGRSDIGSTVIGDGSDEVEEGMLKLIQLKEEFSTFDINDMSIRQTKRRPRKFDKKESQNKIDDDFDSSLVSDPDFADEIDSDVLASRRRYAQKLDGGQSKKKSKRQKHSDKGDSYQLNRHRKTKTPRRHSNEQSSTRESSHSSSRSQSPTLQASKVVTGAGAVKSALNRIFGRNSIDDDPYVVDLGIFSEGRPKLEPGIGGTVIPVFDDLPSTIIAHSLTSTEYNTRLKHFSDATQVKDSSSLSKKTGPKESTNGNFDQTMHSSERATTSRRTKRRDDRRNNPSRNNVTTPNNVNTPSYSEYKKMIEKRMLARQKTHIKHTFSDYDEKGQPTATFVCTTYWATQFEAVRQVFLHSSTETNSFSSTSSEDSFEKWRKDIEKNYVKSLSSSANYAAKGGKSGASFSRTADERFIVKCISRTELQMFLEIAPAYFEYLSKAFFHGLPTMLCKIVGVYQIGVANRVSGKRTMDRCVCVMQNIFFGKKITKVFDLKGSLRGRFAKNLRKNDNEKDSRKSSAKYNRTKKTTVKYGSDTDTSDDNCSSSAASYPSTEEEGDDSNSNDAERKLRSTTSDRDDQSLSNNQKSASTMLDGDFLEWSDGRPLPLNDRAKAAFRMSILNDTLFLSIINVLDYSLLVGIDEEKNELVVSIIDFLRQYDILKQMERVGKSIPMVVGSEAPTIIQPPLYKARFINAMERYFMTIPNKWTQMDNNFFTKKNQ